MENETLRNISQGIIWIGSIFVLLGSFGVHIYTKKIDSDEKNRRERIEKKNIEMSQKLLDKSSFFAEFGNNIEQLFLILKLNENYKVRDLKNFECLVNVELLKRSFKFKYTVFDQEGTKVINEEVQSTLDIWADSNHHTQLSGLKTNPDIVMLELFPAELRGEYSKLYLKDLQNTAFEFAITKEHTQMIDRFIFNANDWNIYGRLTKSSNWKETHETWLGNTIRKYSVYYREVDGRHFTKNIIDLYSIEVVKHLADKNSLISTNPTGKESMDDVFKNINSNEGSLGLTLNNKWLRKDGNLIFYINNYKKGNFELSVYRDIDNKLKVKISTAYFQNEELVCDNFEQFSVEQKLHDTIITWSEESLNFYINTKLVAKKVR